MTRQIEKGYTLIELMITVTIIGLLAAAGMPAYQSYAIRSQIAEGPALASSLKTATAEYYSDKGYFPVDNDVILGDGVAGSGTAKAISGAYVQSITSATGWITITYGNKANTKIAGSTLMIVPATTQNDDITWICGDSIIPMFTSTSEGIPGNGTAQSSGAVTGTTVKRIYLPAACRP